MLEYAEGRTHELTASEGVSVTHTTYDRGANAKLSTCRQVKKYMNTGDIRSEKNQKKEKRNNRILFFLQYFTFSVTLRLPKNWLPLCKTIWFIVTLCI